MLKKNIKIGIIGLGYVGLPLAIEFGKKFKVIGYDQNKSRIKNLKNFIDLNYDIKKEAFEKSKKLLFSDKIDDIAKCNTYIVTVPTPILKNKKPDLSYLKKACINLSVFLKDKDIVIFESTVYPGLTEEFCAPLLQKHSNLIFNKDFFCGYSPERINPNDKKHTLENIVKITSGSNKLTANFVDQLYKKIIKAGTFKVSSIKIAEAAKVIENSQRDLNIAFMNELSIIFNKLGINTNEVLKAASTKWNFLNFSPGLVGGHCIGVDPYYLTYKSQKEGYNPKIISAGRLINDKFTDFVIKKALISAKKKFKNTKIKFLILGLTFKENCVDYRNSKSIELIKKLRKKNYVTHCFDPLVNRDEFYKKHRFKVLKKIQSNFYHCCIISVAHNEFKKMGNKKIRKFLVEDGIIFDVKNILTKHKNNIYL